MFRDFIIVSLASYQWKENNPHEKATDRRTDMPVDTPATMENIDTLTGNTCHPPPTVHTEKSISKHRDMRGLICAKDGGLITCHVIK